MLTEMLGKGGNVCQPARDGQLRCPLIIRPTSEDVITGHLFQALRILNPRWWLPDLLNGALGTARFRTQVYRRLQIELWKNRPVYPSELLPWNEGSTQIDVTIRWENPPTTVLVEMKYLAELSARTAANDGRHGYPSDQLIRTIRVGLWECGWFRPDGFFPISPRDLVVLVIGPGRGNPLVELYRHGDCLLDAIPCREKLRGLPRLPFVGEASYQDIRHILRQNRRWLTRAERQLLDDLVDYLSFKSHQSPATSAAPQVRYFDFESP